MPPYDYVMALRLTAHESTEMVLPVSREACADLCRRALEGLGWEVSESGEAIEAAEPAERLCCVTWPVDLTITVGESTPEGTPLSVEAATPGRGPLQRRQLRDRLAQLREALLERSQKE